MSAKEKRRQVRARKEHRCYICGQPIRKGREYIVYHRQIPIGGGWEEYKRHIHCDALLRFYAEKMHMDAANVTSEEMRQFVNFLCDTEHMDGFRKRCGHDGFSCGEVLYILRHRPGYSEVLASARDGEG